MKLRSPISLELVRQGYLRGSKEFKAAYERMRRANNPEAKKKRAESWKKYYAKKMKETNGAWTNLRCSEWRMKNPLKWKALMTRSTEGGVNKRFYQKHKEKIKKEKSDAGKKQRRKEPTFGLKQAIADCRKGGDIEKLKSLLVSKINELD